MGVNNVDIQMSQAAHGLLGLAIECKNRAKMAVYTDYQQACEHADGEPIVVIKQNRSKPLAVMDLDYFIKILKGYINERNRRSLLVITQDLTERSGKVGYRG